MKFPSKFLCLALTATAAVIIVKSASVRAQQSTPAGEWRAYGSDLRGTKYLPAHTDHGRELRHPQDRMAVEIRGRVPEPDHPRPR